MIRTKYICYGGWITAKDGDRHNISARRLADLYGVEPMECVFINDTDNPEEKLRGFSRDVIGKLIGLSPRPDGNYRLPT